MTQNKSPYKHPRMDWAKAIERNCDALAAIIAALAAMLRLEAGDAGRISKNLRRAVLRLLQPAESAVRRLIVLAARGLVVKLVRARPLPAGRVIPNGANARLAFPLFDAPKRFLLQPRTSGPRVQPRIRILSGDPRVAALAASSPAPPPPPRETTVDARRLRLRFEALEQALGDLPRQARRLARLRARRAAAAKPVLFSPLRPGHAPGYRRRRSHPVDDTLAECQHFARQALADTS